MADDLTLEIPPDPALAVTARMFVSTAARSLRVDDATVDDLRLAASELIANAVESGTERPVRLTMTSDGDDLQLTATGVGAITDGEPVSRRSLLQSLFENARFGEDGSVRIPVPQTA